MKFSLNELWTIKDFNNLVKVLGFASGMIDEDTKDEKLLKAYKDVAIMCDMYLKTYRKHIGELSYETPHK